MFEESAREEKERVKGSVNDFGSTWRMERPRRWAKRSSSQKKMRSYWVLATWESLSSLTDLDLRDPKLIAGLN